MVTLAQQPYPGLTNEDVMEYVYERNVMTQPTDCPEAMYAIMEECWRYYPKDRPSFVELVQKFLSKFGDAFKGLIQVRTRLIVSFGRNEDIASQPAWPYYR